MNTETKLIFPIKKEFDSSLAEKSYFLSIHIRFAKKYFKIRRKRDYDDKFPYGKPQTDEVARGSGTESMAVRD